VTLDERLAIAARLAELTQRGGGRLTPEAVVKDAANKSSPLHAVIFRQGDREAAHQHRLNLARQLIRSVKINETVHHQTVSVVAYVKDPSDAAKSGYVPTVSLINDRERSLALLQLEFTRIEGIVSRSRAIAQVLNLEAELDGLLENILQFVERARQAA
jgi:hypothetical protein